jgi:hypothetical protein
VREKANLFVFFREKVPSTKSKLQKKGKIWGAAANFSLFTFHFSLFFVPLHPQNAFASDL